MDGPTDLQVGICVPWDIASLSPTRLAEFYKLDFEAFAKYTPTGTAEQIAEYLYPFVEAGASTLSLTVCGPDSHDEIEAVSAINQLLS